MRMGVGKAKNVLSTCESRPFEWRKPRSELLAEKHTRKGSACDRTQRLRFMRHTSTLAMHLEMPSLLATGHVFLILDHDDGLLFTSPHSPGRALHTAHTSPSQHPDHLRSSRCSRHPSAISCCHPRPRKTSWNLRLPRRIQ